MGTISIVTPSHRRDLDRCTLLFDSIDRHVSHFDKHYVIVNDEDVAIFSRFASDRRVVLPVSDFLPAWLRPMPFGFRWRGRRSWWSWRAKPVHGWHVQQLAKIQAATTLPEDRLCMIDSDVVFYRDFDMSILAAPNPAPLYLAAGAIAASSPLHSRWVVSAHRLLGLSEPHFPADDHIGNMIVWDRRIAGAMIARIEAVTGLSWQEALCRQRDFSEYLLYGTFVRSDPVASASSAVQTQSFSLDYWDAAPLDAEALRSLLSGAPAHCVALCVQSFSGTPVATIHAALDEFAQRKQRAA